MKVEVTGLAWAVRFREVRTVSVDVVNTELNFVIINSVLFNL